MSAFRYLHRPVGEVFEAIGGEYWIEAERRAKFEDKELLYLICTANIDHTCCGVGGCQYIVVVGFSAGSEETPEGKVSQIEPVPPYRREIIRKFLKDKENISQVQFYK